MGGSTAHNNRAANNSWLLDIGRPNLFVPNKFSAVVGHDVQAISFHNPFFS